MKNLLLCFLLTTGMLSASAQTTATTSGRSTLDTIGTTLIGLPVLKSYVAPDAVERAKKKYGRALYSIEKSTAENCIQSYLVGLIQRGHLTMEWMCDDPKMVLQLNKVLSFDVASAD